jgi:hypothetical protein
MFLTRWTDPSLFEYPGDPGNEKKAYTLYKNSVDLIGCLGSESRKVKKFELIENTSDLERCEQRLTRR